MSLMVGVHWLDPVTGELDEFLWPGDRRSGWIAGFESYRYDLWSHTALIRRGATFLPVLNGAELYILPDDLDAFETECLMIGSQATEIADEIDPPVVDAKSITFYIGNFLDAIKIAREIGGVVYIG